MNEHPIDRLRAQVAAGELDADAAQLEVAGCLDTLSRTLSKWRPSKPGLFSFMNRKSSEPPRGLYIYGPVGRGKTMLLDIFFELVDFAPKRRCHFHEFMADVHERIGAARKSSGSDPIPIVAAEIAAEAGLLCFDELQVTDIADAMILGRLFAQLFERDVVVVATSNQHPTQLYKDGLNRQLFLPFVALIEQHMDTVELASAKDYRLDKLAGQPLYFTPVGANSRAELDKHWDRLTGGHPGRSETHEVKGHKVEVPQASMGIARFSFADLCDRPLGALDYLHIAHTFHTVIIDGIPVLGPQRRNEARRFITLVDALYDNDVCLIASAEAEPADLYKEGPGAEAFERTVSRLMEMRSEAYLAERHEEHPERASQK